MVFWVRAKYMYRNSHGSAAVVLEQTLAARRSRNVSAGCFRALARGIVTAGTALVKGLPLRGLQNNSF